MAINYDREKQELTRRNFLSLATWTGLTVGIVGAAGVFGKFFWPNVSYGPPSKFSIGKPTNFPDGAKQNIADQKVSIIRHGNQDRRDLHGLPAPRAAPSPPRRRVTTAPATAPSTMTWAM